jgi:hypothetical protein
MSSILPADISNIYVYSRFNKKGYVKEYSVKYDVRLTDGTIHCRCRLKDVFRSKEKVEDLSVKAKDLTGKTYHSAPVAKANEVAMKNWIIAKENLVGAKKVASLDKENLGALHYDKLRDKRAPMTREEISKRNDVRRDRQINILKQDAIKKDALIAALQKAIREHRCPPTPIPQTHYIYVYR